MKEIENQKPIFRHRVPTKDELALGYALDTESERETWQLKGVPQSDRATHFYVIGASGTGKSKFLEFLIAQDIKNGNGFGVIDPHGDLIEAVKSRVALTGYDLEERAVVIDPTDKEFSVCFNPLEKMEGVSAAELAAELVLVFKKIWYDAWGARMEDIFRNTLIALIENGLTLAEVPTILTNAALRANLTSHIENETCREFFQKFDSWSKNTRAEWTESTLNKVNAFLSDERIRDIFVSPKSSFNLRKIMDEGKILLIKLDKGRLKGASDLLGSLLLSKIQMAAFSRADIHESERKPFYLYIDEFQNFATESFADTLAEARKYKLSLTLANQNLVQLPSELRAAILTNCGLQAYFRISRYDAELLAKESYAGVFAEPQGWETYIQQLQSLPPRVCLVKSKIAGGVILIEVPPIHPAWEGTGADEERFAKVVRELDIGEDYLRKREDIEKEYRARRETLGTSQEPEGFRRKRGAATDVNYEEMIKGGENNHIEFKQSLRWDFPQGGGKPNKTMEYFVCKAISSFMNSEGGSLFIGVKDNGEIFGIENDYVILKEDKDGFLLHLDQTINKYLGKEFNQFTDVSIVPIEGKDVCIVEVAASKMPVYVKDGDREEFYTRASASSQPMKPREMNDYIKAHFSEG